MTPTRRELLGYALSAAAMAHLRPVHAAYAQSTPKLAGDPFAMLGIASGDPTPDGVVLWCRLALDLEDGARWGLSEDAYEVGYEVRDLEASGSPVVSSGRATAHRDKGYAVHVEASGLKPRTRYRYRFALGDYGAEGVTLTAPAAGDMPDKLRFGFCSCAEYEFRYPHAYELMAREEPHFIVHLGDYIYETTYDAFFRRDFQHPPSPRPECANVLEDNSRVRWLKHDRVGKIFLLSQFRRRYGEYKRDPRLRAAHAKCPFIVTWDDHEVENDYAGDISEIRETEDFIARRVAAYRAYFENLPIRISSLPVSGDRRQLYRSFDFGRLLRLNMLDERQYRSDQACPKGLRGSGQSIPLASCPDIEATIDSLGVPREILGTEQKAWLGTQLVGSPARWNILAQGVMMAFMDGRAECGLAKSVDKPMVWTDGWSGYIAARQEMVELMRANRDKNPVVISGDVHAFFVNRILSDWKDQNSVSVAPEFVVGAISSHLRNYEPLMGPGSGNEGTVVDLDCRHHGYMIADVTPETFDVTAKRVMPSAAIENIAEVRAEPSFTYRVTAGDPEPRKL